MITLFATGPITEQQFKVRLLGVLIAVIIGLATYAEDPLGIEHVLERHHPDRPIAAGG
jgi:hypothetical protein